MLNKIIRGKCTDISSEGKGVVKYHEDIIFCDGLFPNEEADIEIGDIVAYEKGEGMIKRIIIHRVIDRTEEGLYLLKGDNNSRPDDPVQRYRIKYRITMPESAENIEIYGVP